MRPRKNDRLFKSGELSSRAAFWRKGEKRNKPEDQMLHVPGKGISTNHDASPPKKDGDAKGKEWRSNGGKNGHFQRGGRVVWDISLNKDDY